MNGTDPNTTPPPEHHAGVGTERLARVYAEALLAAATDAVQVAQVIEEIDSLIDDVFRNYPRLEALFAGSAVARTARQWRMEMVLAHRAGDLFCTVLVVVNRP